MGSPFIQFLDTEFPHQAALRVAENNEVAARSETAERDLHPIVGLGIYGFGIDNRTRGVADGDGKTSQIGMEVDIEVGIVVRCTEGFGLGTAYWWNFPL